MGHTGGWLVQCAQLYDDVDRLQAQVQQLQEELRQAHLAKAQVSERMQQQLRNLEEMNRQERMVRPSATKLLQLVGCTR